MPFALSGKKAVRREQLYLRRQRIPAKDHKYNEIGIITADPNPQTGWRYDYLCLISFFSDTGSRNHLLGQGDTFLKLKWRSSRWRLNSWINFSMKLWKPTWAECNYKKEYLCPIKNDRNRKGKRRKVVGYPTVKLINPSRRIRSIAWENMEDLGNRRWKNN